MLKITGVSDKDLGTKVVLAAAAFHGIPFDFVLATGSCCGSDDKKNAFKDVRPAVTLSLGEGLGTFCGHLTICRHFVESKKKGDSEADLFLRSDAASWMEFFYERFDVGSRCASVDKVTAKSTSELSKCIRATNAFLTTKTYLVGEALTVADFTCAVTIDHLLSVGKLDEAFVNEHMHALRRLLRTVKSSDGYATYAAKLESLTAGPESFVLDVWKKTYSNCKGDLAKEVMPWLWEHVDLTRWSFWYMRYDKLPDDWRDDDALASVRMSNLVTGFLEHVDPAYRRFSFAVLSVLGAGKDLEMRGVWLLKGLELPPQIAAHTSIDVFSFTRLDVTKEHDKKTVTEYFCSEDTIGGVEIFSSKVWK